MSVFGIDLSGLLEQIDMAVDSQRVDEVISLLNASIDDIKARPVEPVSPAAFGNLGTAAMLGQHTTLARDTVVEALEDVVTGLQVYAENVDAYRKDAFATDEVVGASFTPLQAGTDCAGGDFADQNRPTAPQCTVPGGSDT
ncbi:MULTISPECIES: hypothetical protein [unclassified Nocardioides]|uniref:hypothetical protein n=1 Tax=unclassified Nocardioides TaxID=2615069 RepID=UPI00266715C3|nr:hypothetical protein [Nocardioides sp. Arc9.136]WKN49739.1 hypothetical protein OSR43_06325 [Nocardioides sp. Arc9.136]